MYVKKILRSLLIFTSIMATALISGCNNENNQVSNQTKFVENVHYKIISSPIERPKNDVIEFFWFGCPHCYSAAPFVKKWLNETKQNPVFTLAHSQLYEKWSFDATVFYGLKQLGANQSVIDSFFVSRQESKISDESDLSEFLVSHGYTLDQLKQSSSSKETIIYRSEMSKIESSINTKGVPAFLVGGKYVVMLDDFKNIGGWSGVCELIDYLVGLSKQSR